MLSRHCAEVNITERPRLSKEALLSLASLISSHLDSKDHVHDNLLETTVDAHKGGHRGATTTSGPDDPERKRTVPIDGTIRSDLIDLMARILVVVFHEEGGKVDDRGLVQS